MPAITVDNTEGLPKIATPDTTQRSRPIVSVTTAPKGLEGEGFPVRRAFAGVDLAQLDPFIHLDQMGEVNYAPGEAKGTPWHPHRGFETVTYMIDGVMEHHDSTGGGGLITNGDTQWMTAGSGLLHIEAPPADVVAAGGPFHGLQLWVNLPRAEKMVDPAYQQIDAGSVPLLTTADGGALVRIIAGHIASDRGPGSTHSPMNMVHATLSPGANLVVPWPADFNALVYVLAGNGTVGEKRRPVHTGQLTVFGAGDTLTVEAAATQDGRSPVLDVLILGGRPIGEPVAWHGPFVMNTDDEIRQAYEDFEAGRLGTIPR
ncbi:MAG TPA: pirin family protein [Ilumatobacteraceae bacterium]|nr:pirin family protein [Ilumatobacteraceae bacterium]